MAKIRPSTLAIRLTKTGIADDNKNVNHALKGIRKQIGIHNIENKTTEHIQEKSGKKINIQEININITNKIHKSIWNAMKKYDAPKLQLIEQNIRARNIQMNGVTYTLLIHAHLIFNANGSTLTQLIEEMKQKTIHPALIRFNARIVASCIEMQTLHAKPLRNNILQMARAAWITAVLITRRYPTHDHIIQKEIQVERQHTEIENEKPIHIKL
ncbi:uncharacterized protein BXIN_0264 [Babesia sp. Xinjiang]|uniref:uncharacterized protein n=1 Tax=Babesia sp. Xinjiang TaxID=462227 RepID=UPI000A225EAC|nr:uncharacterized protein BXIN_0264 [Babesia sp. Xinjiang]ORM39659.1 hypothetical protein BXIN_0264 [Babesia sp. Xinjiang]